ncbi:hypothetical protein V1227_05925 [Lentzea sp. DG1S-22]|uniref:hypothetical protein n=1 Tax=Lentzea sp. DG1S-22 TaxID=3108822 RepID=UPI002E772271|nr:hypothetical protein [Lentzea sp. DG1S-22]WVH82296.1 hypothetical protein V1227_05925 [Lentzea sp. DG1S-22]
MYALLYALNEASERVIDYASDALEAMSDEIAMATNGYDRRGREIGVSDMQDTIERMNGAEEIVSRSQESQLLLAALVGTAAESSDDPKFVGVQGWVLWTPRTVGRD